MGSRAQLASQDDKELTVALKWEGGSNSKGFSRNMEGKRRTPVNRDAGMERDFCMHVRFLEL